MYVVGDRGTLEKAQSRSLANPACPINQQIVIMRQAGKEWAL